jgi:uncharacterized protein
MREVFAEIEVNPPAYSLLNGLLDRVNLSAPHEHVCGVGQNYLVIDTAGRIAQCQMAIDHPVGDLSDRDPLEIVRLSTSNLSNPSVEQRIRCRECNVRNWCAGGCPLDALRRTGSTLASSQYCQLLRRLIPEVLYLEGIRMMKQSKQSIV